MIAQERQSQDEEPIEDVVGKINPREPDVIQALRRSLRLQGKAFNTERAYVQKIRAFMEDRGLKNQSDFESIGAADVESHLTDLAVDGNVAPSTQNQASAELAEKYVQQRGVKPSGMRALFASVFSTMLGKARDVRDENRPDPHPPAPSPRIDWSRGKRRS